MKLTRWSVDYGDGPHAVSVPHSWGQDVPLPWEGPALYRTEIDVPRGGAVVRFWGVSYRAEVSVNGQPTFIHDGIWDAFDVPVPGGKVVLEVRVIKNGGATFPVRDVASGFLPYVFHTFGGIFREVQLVPSTGHELLKNPAHHESELPYLRGLLHWGWYPELGHPNPDEETIRREVQAIKARGFNCVKFCLWVPPHRYLEILEEEGMIGWLELPVWNPNLERLDAIANEIERIVLQYRHHAALRIWTIGCELGAAAPAAWRQTMVDTVRALTGAKWVKDNSGGAEMYGGDRREYGDFADFHPYCDLPFFEPVLNDLATDERPILLGEFNDHDVHRNVSRLGDELPYWASALSELNAQGVRWQYDLPRILDDSRFANEPSRCGHRELMEASRQKGLFIRKHVVETVRGHASIRGYVVTGLRDTPISSSGMFDDWGEARYSETECRPWNGDAALLCLPGRMPGWQRGGNRPGGRDPYVHFAGDVFMRLRLTSGEAPIAWRVVSESGEVVARGSGDLFWPGATVGAFTLEARSGAVSNAWPLWVVPRLETSAEGWGLHDPTGAFPELTGFGGQEKVLATGPFGAERGVRFLTQEGTLPMPFWRECIQSFAVEGPFTNRWERLYAVSPDCVLDPAWLASQFGEYETLIQRIDTRTYAEHPILVRAGGWLITTLRPQGGLGAQPPGLRHNPAGHALLAWLMSLV